MNKNRKYCSFCGGDLDLKSEGGIARDHCSVCQKFFYNNPLPVASNIVIRNREILLVKRKNAPYVGLWCLPMGFAESGESIEDAALRELQEETGILGKTLDLVHVETSKSDNYGDLLHLTFESEWVAGDLMAGDDASDLNFFPLDRMPDMAFRSNINAIEKFVSSKSDFWAILNSFSRSVDIKNNSDDIGDFLSDKLVRLVEENAEVITNRWLEDVSSRKSTRYYSKVDPEYSFKRNEDVIRKLGSFLGGSYSNKEIKNFYRKLGQDRKEEGFQLSEVLSALSLSRKHIWEFAVSQGMWKKPIEIYMALELERRMMLFFDKAAFHIARGYEKA